MVVQNMCKKQFGLVNGLQVRIVDQELDELLPGLPAISIEGPK